MRILILISSRKSLRFCQIVLKSYEFPLPVLFVLSPLKRLWMSFFMVCWKELKTKRILWQKVLKSFLKLKSDFCSLWNQIEKNFVSLIKRSFLKSWPNKCEKQLFGRKLRIGKISPKNFGNSLKKFFSRRSFLNLQIFFQVSKKWNRNSHQIKYSIYLDERVIKLKSVL